MGEVVHFQQRASKAHRALSPILGQEVTNNQEARRKRRSLMRNIRHGFVWGVIWIITLAAIGLFTGV